MPGPPTAGFSHWGSSHRQWQTPAAGLGKQQLTARSGVACDGAALTSGGSGGVRPPASGKSPTASQRRPSATGHNQSRVPQQRPGTVGVRGPPPQVANLQWQANAAQAPPATARAGCDNGDPAPWGSGGRPAASGKTNPSPGRGGPGAVPPPVAKPTRAPVVGVRGPSRRQWQNQPEPRSWGSGGSSPRISTAGPGEAGRRPASRLSRPGKLAPGNTFPHPELIFIPSRKELTHLA